MADVFISYKSEERPLAADFARALHLEGLSTWHDERLQPAEVWDKVIEREIRMAGVVVTLWTQMSVKSDWVREEAGFALKEKKLLPVRAKPCEPPLGFAMLQAPDLFTDGKPLREHPGWPAFIAHVRRMLAANAALTAEQLAEIDRQARKRKRADGVARAVWRTVGFLVFIVALAAGAGAWDWWRNTHKPFDVTTNGLALALDGLQAEQTASHVARPPSGRSGDVMWRPAVAMRGDLLALEEKGGVLLYARKGEGWDFASPTRLATSCSPHDPELCHLSSLHIMGGDNGAPLLVAAYYGNGDLWIWSNGRKVDFETSQACGGDPWPTACGVTAFAADPSAARFAFGFGDGALYGYLLTRPDLVVRSDGTSLGDMFGGQLQAPGGGSVASIAFADDNVLAAGFAGGSVQVFDGMIEGPLSGAWNGSAPQLAGDCLQPVVGVAPEGRRAVAWCAAENGRLLVFDRPARGRDWSLTRTYGGVRFEGGLIADSRIVMSPSGAAAVISSGEHALVYDLEEGRFRDIGHVAAAAGVDLRGREAFIAVGPDSRTGMIDGTSIGLWDASATELARANVTLAWTAAIDLGSSSRIGVALPAVSQGRITLWSVSDGGAPLLQLPSR